MATLHNRAKEKLEAGELSIGLGLRLVRTMDIGRVLNTCGYDFAFIDMEHNSMSIDTAVQIGVACQDAGVTPLVRVPGYEHYLATRVLDAGAMGIVFPHVDSAEQAAKLVSYCKYPPVGHRSAAGNMSQLTLSDSIAFRVDFKGEPPPRRALFEELKAASLKVGRAWTIKETARGLWSYVSRGWAIKAWKRWIAWALRSRLEPIAHVAKTIREQLWGIVNAIVLRVTNARAESLNARIQWIKNQACGYRNRERFRDAIFFHLGGLDLHPRPALAHTKA